MKTPQEWIHFFFNDPPTPFEITEKMAISLIEKVQKDATQDIRPITKKEIRNLLEASPPRHVSILLYALLILSHRMDKIQGLIADTHEIEDDLAPGESHMIAMAWAIRREFGIGENWE